MPSDALTCRPRWTFPAQVRARAEVRGKPADTQNWGGSSINDHHSFIVIYRPEDDKHLDMHIDACDVTSPEASWI